MARLRSSRYLVCFYCGQRSKLKYDGFIRDFLCLHCDATNYLDENGEITDPPVATEHEATPRSYVVSKPSSSSPDSIFCKTCLNNQHLFTKCLAQYLPDDPTDTDSDELDGNYYRFRKGLEQRYPQVCEDCAVKVNGRIQQSAYTARTDHLRRVMERSRRQRAAPKTTVLDWIHSLGKWMWWAGFAAQLLWHLVAVMQEMDRVDEAGMYDPDNKNSWTVFAFSGLRGLVTLLPESDTLIRWSITGGILSAWWNPHFVQVNRGFTKHLLGFTQWYSFQGLIVFLRCVFRSVLNMEGGRAQTRNAQLSAHLMMATVMGLIYFLAGRSITVDTRPLFGDVGSVSPRQSPKLSRTPAQQKADDSKTFSELVDEALESPSATPQPQLRQTNFSPSRISPISPIRSHTSPNTPFSKLGVSDHTPQRAQKVQYSDEMDWSPIQPIPRALSGDPAGAARPFGQAPVREGNDPFWFKVPPAPVNPAQRLRNPSNVPALMRKPVEKEMPLFTARGAENPRETRRTSSEIDFKQPKFFAQDEHDDASSLADMLGRSFNLSQGDETPKKDRKAQSKFLRRSSTGAKSRPGSRGGAQPYVVEPAVLAVSLSAWLLTTMFAIPYATEIRLVVLCLAGIIALSSTGDSSGGMGDSQSPGIAAYVFSVLSVVELAAVCWVAWEVGGRQSDVEWYGAGVLGVMLGHQAWESYM